MATAHCYGAHNGCLLYTQGQDLTCTKFWWSRLGTRQLDGLPTVYLGPGSHMSKILVATSGNMVT